MVNIISPAGSVMLDAALSVVDTLAATVTDHPIETGGFVTDHVIEHPECIKIEGVITETPLVGDIGEATSARDLLKEAKATKEPCTITDDSTSYERMVLEQLEFPRDGQTGEAVKFTAIFKEVRFVASRTVAVQRSQKPAKQSKGKQSGKEADSATQERAKTGAGAAYSKVAGRASNVIATPGQ